MKPDLLKYALAIIALLALWTFWPRDKPDVGEAKPLPPAKEVRTVEKIIERPKYIYVYPDEVKPKLGLGSDVLGNVNAKVTATGKLDAEERPYTLSAVLDMETGESKVYARPDPLPWIAPGKHGQIGIAYGLKNGQPAGRLYAGHELLRVKQLNAGANGTVDTDGEWFAGGYVEYRF